MLMTIFPDDRLHSSGLEQLPEYMEYIRSGVFNLAMKKTTSWLFRNDANRTLAM